LKPLLRYRFIFADVTANDHLAIACSLGASEYAERLREFRRLFAVSLRASEREPTVLHLRLDSETAHEAAVRDLFRREHECCPFFRFDVERVVMCCWSKRMYPGGGRMSGRPRTAYDRVAHKTAMRLAELPIGQVARRAGVGVQTVRY
jgi:hypothetical protein